jgi:peptide/nickel transport system permease protein
MDMERIIPALHKTLILFLRMVLLLIGLSVLTFGLIHLSPLDPITAYVSNAADITPEQVEKLRIYWGLNKSPVEQYFSWASSMLHGDFGTSKLFRRPVIDIIKNRFTVSFALMGTAWVLSALIGYSLGVIAAMNRGRLIDRIIKWYSYTQVSTPIFWMGLLLMIIFSLWLGWFPIGLAAPAGIMHTDVSFAERLRHFVLPAATLSVLGIASVALHTREKMIDILNAEFSIFARSRGETKWQFFKHHGFRNSILPAVSLQFSYFGELFGGSVLAEQVFAYPGLGSTLTNAGLKGDLPLLIGIIFISAIFVFSGNFIADVLNTVIDPRIKGGLT